MAGLAIIESARKRKSLSALFCVALAFTTITLTFVPPEAYDLYRHYLLIDSLKGVTFSYAFNNADIGYRLFNSYAWLINAVGFPKQIFPASVVFFSYLLFFLVFRDLKLSYAAHVGSKALLLIFCIFWLSLSFVAIAGGIRNGFANVVVFYVSYHLFFYNKVGLFFVGGVFSLLVHPFAALPLILAVFSKCAAIFSKYSKALVFVGVFFILIPDLSYYVVGSLTSFIESYTTYKLNYFRADSKWGGGYSEMRSLKGLFVSYGIKRLTFYFGVIYLLIVTPKKNDCLYLMLCGLAFFIGTFFYFYMLSGRAILIFTYFFCVYLSIRYLSFRDNVSRLFAWLFFSALVLHSILHLYEYEELIFSSYDWMYKPFLFILFAV
jgi:hypothetical protein